MRQVTAPLLERFRVFRSGNIEETRAFLAVKGFEFETPGRRGAAPHDARLNGAYLPGMYIGYIQYGGAAVSRTTAARTDYWIQLPLRGQIETRTGSRTVLCGRATAFVASPNRLHAIHSGDGSARCHLSLNADALRAHLVALLGDEPDRPLELEPVLTLSTGYGRVFASYVRAALEELERGGALLHNAAAASAFEQALMTSLLLRHPNNYSALLRGRGDVAPRDVKRAIDYIHAHLDAPMTVADLVAASGVAGRTLFQHFRAFTGVSPMRYLRDARFEETRRTLRRAGPQDSITAIAGRWGFTHMGRFSTEYRRRFGETPSETRAPKR